MFESLPNQQAMMIIHAVCFKGCDAGSAARGIDELNPIWNIFRRKYPRAKSARDQRRPRASQDPFHQVTLSGTPPGFKDSL